MKTYQISNSTSGQILGTYKGETPAAALQAMLDDAGCTDPPAADLVATEVKIRTVSLTGRRPVKIVEAAWPVLAHAYGDSYQGNDYARHQQAQARGEVDKYSLLVRQHTDGRALVYAVCDAAISAWGQPAGGEDYRAGELLQADALPEIPEAIRRVGDAAGLPDALIRECIADLPAEEI